MTGTRISAAEMLLRRLSALGVDYVFINSGTDYPPVIEAVAKAGAEGRNIPELVICPHENAAMGMAHGYYLGTRKSQAVMLHTDVGLANGTCAMLNHRNSNIPTLLFSGRTPISERGHFGSRNTPIGYGQEMRDQAALVREAAKWDFELRLADQIADHVDRAHAIANSLPRGPVYLSLPREPLAEIFEAESIDYPPPQMPVRFAPDPDSIRQAAEWIAGASQPVAFAQRGARSPEGFNILAKLANRWGIPVVEYWGTEVGISAADPMAAGNEPLPWLEVADIILVVDSQAPWMMNMVNLRSGCKVVQLGPDPLFEKYPVRGYPADINLAGEAGTALAMLSRALDAHLTPSMEPKLKRRRQQVADRNAEAAKKRWDRIESLSSGPITKPFLSHCLGQLAEKNAGTIVSELAVMLEYTGLTRPDSYYQEALAGGLGEGFPIALGLQLADREKLVIAALGDGSYLFSNPAVCHHIAEAYRLPVLVVVANNDDWDAVAGGVRGMYPDGFAARATPMPGVSLTPTPDFVKIAESGRSRGIVVDKAENLAAALAEATDYIQRERRPVLVEAKLEPGV